MIQINVASYTLDWPLAILIRTVSNRTLTGGGGGSFWSYGGGGGGGGGRENILAGAPIGVDSVNKL